MAQLTHGMNIDEVEALGRFLQDRANALNAISAAVDQKVRATSWVGTDADRFRNQWWPNHRKRLTALNEDLKGFGQSALNNASEQRQASDAGGTTGGSKGRLDRSQIASPGGGDPAIERGRGVDVKAGGAVGATSGALPNASRTWQEADAAYQKYAPAGYGPHDSFKYQCTAWANARWRELGYTGPHISGNGGEMAGNAGGSTSNPPTLGAMASYGGHVMIIEEIYPDGRFRVSEMNMGGNGIYTVSPDEFRSTAIFSHGPGGSWVSNGHNVGPITIAKFPG